MVYTLACESKVIANMEPNAMKTAPITGLMVGNSQRTVRAVLKVDINKAIISFMILILDLLDIAG